MFDGTDGKECNQVYAITAAAAASAIASCRPSGPLQSTQEVAVWAKYSAERHVLEVTGTPLGFAGVSVADTGRAIPGAKEVASRFQLAFPEGRACSCTTFYVRSTGVQESVSRNYIVRAASPSSEPEVIEILPVAKHQCSEHGPFSGSQVTFSVPDTACAPLRALDAITAALETITMMAPPVAVSLSTVGFEALLQIAGLEPLPPTLKYDLEPLPTDSTPAQRMKKGFAAFFEPDSGDAREPDLGASSIQDVQVLGTVGEQAEAAHAQHVGESHPSIFFSSYTSAAHTTVDRDSGHPTPPPVSAPAMQWSACAGITLRQTPLLPGTPHDGEDALSDDQQGGSPAPSRLLLFENYGQLQRPQQALLKAVSKAMFWQKFGIVVQSLSQQADGSPVLIFAPDSAPMAGRIELIAVHLVCADVKAATSTRNGRPVGLLKTLEAKLVRSAIEDALAAVKRAHPLELLSLFEQRMRCLRYMGKDVADIINRSTDVEFQERMYELAGCAPDNLADTIQAKAEQAILVHLREEGLHPPET